MILDSADAGLGGVVVEPGSSLVEGPGDVREHANREHEDLPRHVDELGEFPQRGLDLCAGGIPAGMCTLVLPDEIEMVHSQGDQGGHDVGHCESDTNANTHDRGERNGQTQREDEFCDGILLDVMLEPRPVVHDDEFGQGKRQANDPVGHEHGVVSLLQETVCQLGQQHTDEPPVQGSTCDDEEECEHEFHLISGVAPLMYCSAGWDVIRPRRCCGVRAPDWQDDPCSSCGSCDPRDTDGRSHR